MNDGLCWVVDSFLDAKDQNLLEYKLDTFSSVYKNLTGEPMIAASYIVLFITDQDRVLNSQARTSTSPSPWSPRKPSHHPLTLSLPRPPLSINPPPHFTR